jgi:Lon protease-like protein
MVSVEELKRTYPDGRMDISVRGLEAFEVLDFKEKTSGKLYPGGKIQTIPLNPDFDPMLEETLEKLFDKFFNLLGQRPEGDPACLLSFRFAHKLGLSLDQELELLLLPTETARQEFLKLHLQSLLPALEKGEAAKIRIRQNGHFRSFDPLKF